jgi:histidine ammonia-lyase
MLKLTGHTLTIPDLVAVAQQGAPAGLSEAALEAIARSHTWVQDIIKQKDPVYGINTGFGIFSDRCISPEDIHQLSRNLVLSHAVSTGPPLPDECVRAAMLIRANTLAKGHSGVRPIVVKTLLDMLNKELTPIIPSQGSLGSSGDLSPLSHLALVFTRDAEDQEAESGQARYQGELLSGKMAMRKAGIARLTLEAKEGLAIINGATFSAAIAALAVQEALNLIQVSDISLAMTLEALLGVTNALDPRIHQVRPHPGQKAIAHHLQNLTAGSTFLNATPRVQDAYSLRCAPQIHGPALEAAGVARQTVEREINAATDNPLLFEPGVALSGGNFHGESLAMVMDYLKIALTEIGAISERRIFRMTDQHLNLGLPPMLVDTPAQAGLNSGMMMPHYTAASLALENKTLATPDAIHSLPTSAEQEDHNANAMTAARHARRILKNTSHILAIELYTAARALDLRRREMPDRHLGAGTERAYNLIRRHVPYQAGDAYWGPEINTVQALIQDGTLLEAVDISLDMNTKSD